MDGLGRRRFLGALGGMAMLGGTAGCLGRGSILGSDETEPEWPSVPSPQNIPDDATTERTYVIGRRGVDNVFFGKPIGVVIANATASKVEAEILIERYGAYRWTPKLESRHELKPSSKIRFLLCDPAKYRIRLSTPDHEAEKQIPKSDFDCNDKVYSLVVTDDGIDQSSISTTMGCGPF
ncbi:MULTISPECIES: hypothetical protein [Haloferax]|uniref:Tat (Twin-arginine translocation) pathway signal sequence domain-containing protein n=1 Tax=Haloferax marinum TaxID=2666143 RepID=A0A6A8G380_9EURY|nr:MULTISPECIES: hypothetical protein [Haloferax]KAB1196338.1 hypothetical protein Hfx1150_01915 [Haloferax sp. CBA1150]MRW95329.1 hypothetical protein [Haloferax marinum]